MLGHTDTQDDMIMTLVLHHTRTLGSCYCDGQSHLLLGEDPSASVAVNEYWAVAEAS